jgi:hypothetical protein
MFRPASAKPKDLYVSFVFDTGELITDYCCVGNRETDFAANAKLISNLWFH